MKSSLVIVSFFVVGTLVGVSGIAPGWLASGSDVSFYALCALMFFVGMSVGGDSSVLRSIRTVSPRLLLLPLVTVAGTLGGVMLASLLLPHRSLTDCLAVGSGFRSYSPPTLLPTTPPRPHQPPPRRHSRRRLPASSSASSPPWRYR